MIFREILGCVLWRENLLPDCGSDEIVLAEDFVHQRTESMNLVVVDGDEDGPVVPKQLAQELQAGKHHAAPLVVAGQVFPVHDLAQPIADHRRVDLVVVGPGFVAGVVGRVDVDALDLAVIGRQQRLQRGQVVALDDQVVVQARLPAQSPWTGPAAARGTEPPDGGSPRTPCP